MKVLLTILIVAIIANVNAKNYDTLIHHMEKRNADMHNQILEDPIMREHIQNTLSPFYDEDGYLVMPVQDSKMQNALPIMQKESIGSESVSDDNWRSLMETLDKVRNHDRYKELMRNPYERQEDDIDQFGKKEKDDEEILYQNHQSGAHRLLGGSARDLESLASQKNQNMFDLENENNNNAAEEGGSMDLEKFVKGLQRSDENLPAYCSPPNPCPIGYDPETLSAPCDRNVENTKDFNRQWILTKMRNGECDCDSEHMNNCEEFDRNNKFNELRGVKKSGEQVYKRYLHPEVVKKAGKM